jgi:hypothetical protein
MYTNTAKKETTQLSQFNERFKEENNIIADTT